MSTTRSIHFILNDRSVQSDLPPGLTVLEFLRDTERLTGTKAACWEGDCGSCQVLLGEIVNGRLRYGAINSCLLPLGELAGRHLVTIEGLNRADLNPIQHTLVEQGAVQCGFCTPGLVVALTGYLLNAMAIDTPTAIESLSGNLCRCTGYTAICTAVQALCERFQGLDSSDRFQALIGSGILPTYFATIAERLAGLPPPTPDQSATAGAVLVAGGTDLFVREPERLRQAACRFLSRESTLRGLWTEAGHCLIGAATTVAEIRESPLMQACCPTLGDDLALFCSPPVRQRATLAGNLVNASPIGDLIIYFLALDATLELTDGQQSHRVRLRDFYQGYKQVAKRPEEWVTRISFPQPEPGHCFSYEKVCKRQYLDIACVNTALSITLAGDRIATVRLAAGGVAPVPRLLENTATALRGQPLTAATVRAAATVAQSEIAPISDGRGSADYKRLLLRQLIYAHFLKLFPEAIPWRDLA
jgi:xanthine dehydrogenase small subunit